MFPRGYYWRRRMVPPLIRPRFWGRRPWGCGCFLLLLVIAVALAGVLGLFSWFHF